MKTFYLKLIIIGFLLNSCGQISYERFDSDKWQKTDPDIREKTQMRWNMMNDLRNKFKLVGMMKPEIDKLLGKPDYEVDYEYSYYLGMTGTGINTGRLTIFFDKKNKVREIKVTQG